MPHRGPCFDQPVAPDGYVWWYIDGVSDDGRHGLTVIAFLGSVFSPWYAWARRRGPTDPLQHCAVNVVLYGAGGKRWAMTERGPSQVARTATTLRIGPSGLSFDGSVLTIDIDEVTAPWPSRIKGRIMVTPEALTQHRIALDEAGRHRWWPIAPRARIEARFERPGRSWSGSGYFDTNDGDEPLERTFTRWHWCRGDVRDGAAILYEAQERSGARRLVAIRCDRTGAVEEIQAPPPRTLPPTRWWRMERPTRGETQPTVLSTMEDAPFYSRSVIATQIAGEPVRAVHESLTLDRFQAPWVQAVLPFKAPRTWKS
ncbi:MAG TPA: carotenoid 1,2-hydratase [Beijerinckiaceae bacterium]